MTGVLFRTGSGTIHSSLIPGSPRFTVPLRHDSFSGTDKVEFSSLFLEVNNKNNRRRISRAISEPQGSIRRLRSMSTGSLTFPEMLPEVDEELDEDVFVGGVGTLTFAEKCFDQSSWMPVSGISVEETQFSGGSGSGRDRNGFGSGHSGGSNYSDNERNKIGEYYQQMLKSNPNDPLLLRNYGKFLHEVEGNTVKAGEYYGRAILASPGDGELLSLYGKLIWDTEKDGERAKSYFDQAVSASPDDCMVMGSYAQFMWEAEDHEDEDIDEESGSKVLVTASQSMVSAF